LADTPEFQRGSSSVGADSLAYGEAAAANALVSLSEGDEVDDDDLLFQPEGEEEEFLFGPSDRPAEPITTGAPFGPGADVVRRSFQSDDQLVAQVAERIAADPRAPKVLRAFSRRALEGQ